MRQLLFFRKFEIGNVSFHRVCLISYAFVFEVKEL